MSKFFCPEARSKSREQKAVLDWLSTYPKNYVMQPVLALSSASMQLWEASPVTEQCRHELGSCSIRLDRWRLPARTDLLLFSFSRPWFVPSAESFENSNAFSASLHLIVSFWYTNKAVSRAQRIVQGWNVSIVPGSSLGSAGWQTLASRTAEGPASLSLVDGSAGLSVEASASASLEGMPGWVAKVAALLLSAVSTANQNPVQQG